MPLTPKIAEIDSMIRTQLFKPSDGSILTVGFEDDYELAGNDPYVTVVIKGIFAGMPHIAGLHIRSYKNREPHISVHLNYYTEQADKKEDIARLSKIIMEASEFIREREEALKTTSDDDYDEILEEEFRAGDFYRLAA